MAIVSKKKKSKVKKSSVSVKDKIGKVKNKAKLDASSSKLKKKKSKKRRELEEELEAKSKKSRKRVEVDDEDDVGSDDEDEVLDRASVTEKEDGEHTASEASTDDTEDEDDASPVDLSQIDPGPDASEVGCGFNCGSCTKFVKLDDPRRDDPDWLNEQLNRKPKSRCPFLFPDEIEVQESKTVEDYIVRADTRACDHFVFDEDRASPDMQALLVLVRSKTGRNELDVIAHMVERIRNMKIDEDKYGYSIGERVRTAYRNLEGDSVTLDCEVIEFQRRKGAEVIVRVIKKVKGCPARLAIAARRGMVVD